ncbi:Sulphur oxidation protein SoxZ [Chloroherpeton thalassium ATCC 35110]|uniref:Sulphur oxidation protein SoxZ n=1 Tax=Chloroherpeton thalassium (strain ATCC 35110 / GB-78) TaxID=517418 RepID=B3QVQ8_CHLT3|nr:thiosulfate oxidation carrier complex protein SoxZ [Chloroherpeton thalassium]ACF13115.1 Sulphur oxidation protein SoxZ [Chloroherpeton thalassium ATCC 35110]
MAANKIRMVAKEANGIVTVKAVINHPNESGFRKDEDGNFVPAHHLTEAEAKLNGQRLMQMQLGPSIAKNPLISFQFLGKKGDKLHVLFKDNKNEVFTADTEVVSA